jgi:hypothetical protein
MNDAIRYDLNFNNLDLTPAEGEDLLLILLGTIDRYFIMDMFRHHDVPGRTRLHKELAKLPWVSWYSADREYEIKHTNIYDWLKAIANSYDFGRIGSALAKAKIRRSSTPLIMSIKRQEPEESPYNRSDYDFGG